MNAGFGAFQTTQWSLVLKAANADSPESRNALELLCSNYWRPIFHYIRARGRNVTDAQDLTQEFFRVVLEKGYLKQADPNRGRFRAFLKVAIKNFLSNERKKLGRQKRGGDVQFLPLNALEHERSECGAAESAAPESVYDRKWAEVVLSRTLSRVRSEMKANGSLERFEVYKAFILPSGREDRHAEAAVQAGISPQAFKSGVYRFRRRVRSCFFEEVAGTVVNPQDVEEEARELLKCLAEQ